MHTCMLREPVSQGTFQPDHIRKRQRWDLRCVTKLSLSFSFHVRGITFLTHSSKDLQKVLQVVSLPCTSSTSTSLQNEVRNCQHQALSSGSRDCAWALWFLQGRNKSPQGQVVISHAEINLCSNCHCQERFHRMKPVLLCRCFDWKEQLLLHL